MGYAAEAGTTETRSFYSDALQAQASYTCVLPRGYSPQQRYPVIYLLHCAGCCASTSLQSDYQNIDGLIDAFDCIVVLPDGAYCMQRPYFCWWLDSPVRPRYQYATFLVEEVKPHVDSLYATYPGRCNTGLAGHSMGGFGALHLLRRYPAVFGAAFSIKGGLDVQWPPSEQWGGHSFHFEHILDTTRPLQWEQVNILNTPQAFTADSVHIGIYAGQNDEWFFHENRRFHRILDSCGKTHAYWVEPEGHRGVPPRNMERVLMFFDSVFCTDAARTGRFVPERNGRAAPDAQEGTMPHTDAGIAPSVTLLGRSTGRAGEMVPASIGRGVFVVRRSEAAGAQWGKALH
jgi:enterochelin esterase-like enzyme